MDSQLEAFEKFKAAGPSSSKRSMHNDNNRSSRDNHANPGPMPDLYSIHQGKVVRIEDFGAFVEIPGFRRHGLVYKKQLSKHFTENAADVVAVGDNVWVKVTSIQDDKIALSMKYVSQGNGQDLDPNLVQQTGEEDKRRVHGGFMDKAPISIEQGGVLLKTVCKKCGATGHLATECFSMGEKFDLLEDNDDEDNLIMQASSLSSRGEKDKKKKKEKTLDKDKDRDRKRDHKQKLTSSSSSSRHKDSRRGRSRSPSPKRRSEGSRGDKVESLEDALALIRARKQESTISLSFKVKISLTRKDKEKIQISISIQVSKEEE
ncbi:Nucleolar protein of 40 kDa [Gryganskiella cystojenkinii]|nr:Nucleolar protein of 40 kDa [Gryganskiella cystojenkinii]